MKYKLVIKPTPEDLEVRVSELLTEGWKTLGGVSITDKGYAQAMSKAT
jgi:hypothetical protein